MARDQRINDGIGRIIVMSTASGSINSVDRQQIAALIAQQTGLPQADAEKRVGDTWTRFRALQAEAATKVRDAAEKSRRAGMITAFHAAAISLAALAATIWGADAGATDRDANRSFRFLGRERFWQPRPDEA